MIQTGTFYWIYKRKLLKALKIKVEIQMISQENDTDNDFLQALKKKFAKASKKPLGWEKVKLKRDQIL